MADEDTRPETKTEAEVVTEPKPEPAPRHELGHEGEKKPEPVPDLTSPAEPDAVPPRRSIVLPLVLGGIIAAGLGFGLSRVVPNGWPIQDTSALEAEIARQAQEITALRDRVAANAAPDLSGVEGRIAALENAPSPVDELRAQIDQLRGQMTSGAMAPDMQAIVDQTRQQLDQTRAEAQALQQEAEATAQAAGVSAALTRIAAALDAGTPYGTSLEALTSAGIEVPPVLADNAGGLPSMLKLQQDFPAAARAGLEASLAADMGATWSERVGSFLRSQTGARSLTPREGNDPDAVLSRAEAALGNADVAGALSELGQLPLEGQGAMSDWRAEAQRRVDAEAALAALEAR